VQESWKEEREIWSCIPFFQNLLPHKWRKKYHSRYMGQFKIDYIICEPTLIFWNLLVMLYGDGSGVPGHSVDV
jgi:hypothetical protein